MKDAAYVIKKASLLKTGKLKNLGWVGTIMCAIPTRKKLKEAYAVIGTGDLLSGKQSIFKKGKSYKKNC